ncbi:MAG: hypothetical protein JWM40_2973 [Frankiales bacterium]|nr:hypothetical protein [Frankiales bacterium]
MPMRPFTHDLYAPLSYAIGDPRDLNTGSTRDSNVAPTWVDDLDYRRLAAYRFLSAVCDNARKYWLPAQMWEREIRTGSDGTLLPVETSAAERYREYGTGGNLVESARSLVLGEAQTIRVPAAAPTVPEPSSGNPTPPPPAVDPLAAASLAWLEQWAEDEHLDGKLLDSEEHAIEKGDALFVLGWSNSSGRPRLRVYDPGMFFPDWDAIDDPTYVAQGWDDDDFPPVIHVAWELERDGVRVLRRHTWRMVRLEQGRAQRYGVAARWTCLYSVGDWDISRLNGNVDVYNLPANLRTVVVAERDLQLDFIPAVHLTNDAAGQRRFGRALLLRLTQIVDDLNDCDTDLARSAQKVASAPTVTTGTGGQQLNAGPGAHWDLPQGASAAMLDTSRVLDALLKHADRLEDLLSTRSRVSAVLLGRVDPTKVPSGYALRLGFAASESLLREMRRVRRRKHGLLLKMALRMAQQFGPVPSGPTPSVHLELGNSLPSDRAATIQEVKDLLAVHAISTETAVLMLHEAGLPVGDLEEELARIRSESFEQAVQLVEATGDTDAAYRFLGLEPPAAPPAPEPLPVPTL